MSNLENGTGFDFENLEVIEIPFKYQGKQYVLVEADEDTAAAYRNASVRGAKILDGKLVGLPTDVAGVQSLLVAGCLRLVDGNGMRQPVERETVKRWPSRVVKPLFNKAKEISELDEEDETEDQLIQQRAELNRKLSELRQKRATLKNESSATESTSS